MVSLAKDPVKEITSSSKDNNSKLEIAVKKQDDTTKTTDFNIHANMINDGTISTSRLPSASTSQSGIVQLNNTTYSTSTSEAATANAVKSVKDSIPSVPDASTSQKGIVQLYNASDSDSTSKAPTANALKNVANNVPTIYTGSDSSDSLSVGAYILALALINDVDLPNIHSDVSVKNASSTEYHFGSSGLSGTWKCRGSASTTSTYFSLLQRTN